jgi:hypothetical protein
MTVPTRDHKRTLKSYLIGFAHNHLISPPNPPISKYKATKANSNQA